MLLLLVKVAVPVFLVAMVALSVVGMVRALLGRPLVRVVEEVDAEVGEAAGAALRELGVEDLEIALALGAVGDYCLSTWRGVRGKRDLPPRVFIVV